MHIERCTAGSARGVRKPAAVFPLAGAGRPLSHGVKHGPALLRGLTGVPARGSRDLRHAKLARYAYSSARIGASCGAGAPRFAPRTYERPFILAIGYPARLKAEARSRSV